MPRPHILETKRSGPFFGPSEFTARTWSEQGLRRPLSEISEYLSNQAEDTKTRLILPTSVFPNWTKYNRPL